MRISDVAIVVGRAIVFIVMTTSIGFAIVLVDFYMSGGVILDASQGIRDVTDRLFHNISQTILTFAFSGTAMSLLYAYLISPASMWSTKKQLDRMEKKLDRLDDIYNLLDARLPRSRPGTADMVSGYAAATSETFGQNPTETVTDGKKWLESIRRSTRAPTGA